MGQHQAGFLTRALRAAEAWARERTGREMTVRAYSDPERRENGSVTTTVELCCAESSPDASTLQEPVFCITTLEPDGTLSCFSGNKSNDHA